MTKDVLTASLAVLLSVPLPAQAPTPAAQRDFILRADTQLVVLSVSVQDNHGTNISGLKAQDFKIYEDGHPQALKQFAAEDSPVTIGILLDASGSMRAKQAEAVTAALAFVSSSNPQDETFVVDFNDRAVLALAAGVPFSNDHAQLRAALLGRAPEGKTALYDALALAAAHLAKGKWERKVLLIISDGGDNNSRTDLNEAIRAVQKSGAAVYSVALIDEEQEHNRTGLKRLAKMTGGESFEPLDIADTGMICVRIARDIRSSYTLAYTPPNQDQHTANRDVKVLALAPGGGHTRVRTRTSYILGQ